MFAPPRGAGRHHPRRLNIPLDDLRSRLGELPANKEILVFCQVGLRGYLACRILMQKGFKCRNLSGGYKTYCAVTGSGKKVVPYCQRNERRRRRKPSGRRRDRVGADQGRCLRPVNAPGPLMKLKEALEPSSPVRPSR